MNYGTPKNYTQHKADQEAKKDERLFGKLWKYGIILFITVWFSGCGIYRISSSHTTIIVKKMERDNGSSDKYLIFSEQGEVYEIANTYSFWRMNGSDLYGHMEVGKKYRCKVAGWRWPFFSMYRNILEVNEQTVIIKPEGQ